MTGWFPLENSINDLPMFRISDECYAVGNAVEELKHAATGVIGDNDSDSVARWLEENYRRLNVSTEK